MFRFVALFALVSLACGASLPDELDGRIVNGVDTTIAAHPYQVSLQLKSGSHFCGGSIVSSEFIVTAAHCLQSYSASQIYVRLGSTYYNSGGELVSVKSFTYHPGYNSKTMVNDIAVIRLSSPVAESSNIKYIELAEETPATGTLAVVTGWGTKCYLTCISLPTTLQEVEVDIVDEADCASSTYKYGSQIQETMVCAYAVSKDACQGDSGGPLVANSKLVGVVSWGYGCARTGYPGVYSDVPSLRSWVESTMASMSFHQEITLNQFLKMFRFVALFALVSLACGASLPDELDGRIVNGVDTTIAAHPYQVSLQLKSGSHFCGGSIVSSEFIVTAAHCLQSYSASQIYVRLGSTYYNSGGELVSVKSFTYHPGYNSKTMVNDIAVIRLSSPVAESSNIKYIELAEETPATGTLAVVTGWGTKCYLTCISLPTTLQEVEVDIVDEADCASSTYKYGSQIQETMVCAYAVSKDACQGDSGGPLVANSKLVGVVSWGYGCARTGYPGVYSDVPSLRSWVESTMANSLVDDTLFYPTITMLRFIIIICALLSLAFGAYMSPHLDGRIVGGKATTIEEHPYQVSLSTKLGGHFCGGSLISENIVVTAAHCLQSFKASSIRIRAGSTNNKKGGELVKVAAVKYHPNYNASTIENDVGILKLATAIQKTESVGYIELAQTSPATGISAVVTGWGTKCFAYCLIPPTTLQAVELEIVQRADCASNTYKYGDLIKESMLCAYALKKDSCQGDSGGPLVAEGKLVGIVSWGYACAKKGYPGVYSDVASLRGWILEAIAEI
ncbi:transmembrane protease serine 9-like [Anastrepha obliqua]|uniref:transmembrane protease serine 9-like n=1 Tax=Anastrepha obliqua TaxID=95512 RepID=UPI0024095B96|nr:transmembrane protease serine 9-like [Anastrepha obliqua]